MLRHAFTATQQILREFYEPISALFADSLQASSIYSIMMLS
jgi:hypothetical protein